MGARITTIQFCPWRVTDVLIQQPMDGTHCNIQIIEGVPLLDWDKAVTIAKQNWVGTRDLPLL